MFNPTKYVRDVSLYADNALKVALPKHTPAEKHHLDTALTVIAELLDAIARGDVTHVTIGTPRNGSAFLLTVNMPEGHKQYAGFADIYDLGVTAASDLQITAGQA
jgi:hypothetical protein